MNTISVNQMVRDEPFAVYGIMSVIDLADEILVVDTGSTDGTWDELQQLQSEYPDKIKLRQELVENCHQWSIENTQVKASTLSPEASKQLGDIRRNLHKESKSNYVLLLDGDEVYPEKVSRMVHQVLNGGAYTFDCMILPFIDWVDRVGVVRQKHWMGRLFNKDNTEIRGNYPHEMHWQKYRNLMYEVSVDTTLTVNADTADSMVNHYECLIKPYRKEHRIIATVEPYLPEVINEKMLNKFPRIKKYVEL